MSTELDNLVFKYRTYSQAIEMLATGRAWFSSVLNFNDPFDGQWDALWPSSTDAFHELLQARVHALVVEGQPFGHFEDIEARLLFAGFREQVRVDPTSGSRLVNEFLAGWGRESNSRQEWLRVAKRVLRKTRVFSCSKTFKSLLMWSHYADHHRGIVLGFDAGEFAASTNSIRRDVDYADSLPQIYSQEEILAFFLGERPLPPSGQERFALASERIKSMHWQYEDEVRFGYMQRIQTEDLSPADPQPFEQSLRAVICGERMSDAQVGGIRNALSGRFPSVSVWKSNCEPSRFAISVERI